MAIEPSDILTCLTATVSEKLMGLDGNPSTSLISFILQVQDSFQPHLALTPGNAKQLWNERIKNDETIIDFLYTTVSQVRYRMRLDEAQWNYHTSLLADSINFPKGEAIHPALKDRLTNKEIAGQLLRSEPWIVVLVWLTMCPWIIDTTQRRKSASTRSE